MPDTTNSTIDRIYDLVDSFAEKADKVLNRTKRSEEQQRARVAKRQVDVDTAPRVKVKGSPSTSTAIAKTRFRIVESTDAQTGAEVFVVTDGAAARCECSSREMAEKILRALEMAP